MKCRFIIFTANMINMLKKLLTVFVVSLLVFGLSRCNNDSPTPPLQDPPPTTGIRTPDPIIFHVDTVYPHDKEAFTQGLQFYNGKLYEGTGLPGKSTLRIVDIKSGKPLQKYLIPDPKTFGEGITIWNNKIYQLTWQDHKIIIYNLNDITKPTGSVHWKFEGWGITNDTKTLIISDGSDKLYYIRPDEPNNSIRLMKILSVADNNGPVDSLNELEYIDGYIYANKWLTDNIYKIDTTSGHVVGIMNMSGLLQQYAPNEKVEEGGVLNGIAYDSTTKKLYITGKLWPKMFEVRLN